MEGEGRCGPRAIKSLNNSIKESTHLHMRLNSIPLRLAGSDVFGLRSEALFSSAPQAAHKYSNTAARTAGPCPAKKKKKKSALAAKNRI